MELVKTRLGRAWAQREAARAHLRLAYLAEAQAQAVRVNAEAITCSADDEYLAAAAEVQAKEWW